MNLDSRYFTQVQNKGYDELGDIYAKYRPERVSRFIDWIKLNTQNKNIIIKSLTSPYDPDLGLSVATTRSVMNLNRFLAQINGYINNFPDKQLVFHIYDVICLLQKFAWEKGTDERLAEAYYENWYIRSTHGFIDVEPITTVSKFISAIENDESLL